MPGIYTDVPAWDEGIQPLRNAWAVPDRYTVAPDPPGPIPVTVRLHWARDGVQLHEGRATAWTPRLVLVQVSDKRLGKNAVWVEACDVRRR